MKNHKLLKPLLVLALMFVLSSSAMASEVTGTLSSSSGGSTDQASGTSGGSSGGGSTTTSGGGHEKGVVLGSSTMNENNSPALYNIAYGGTALQPNYYDYSGLNSETESSAKLAEARNVGGTVLGDSTVAETLDVSNKFGMELSIIILLILAGIGMYIHNHNKKSSMNY